MSNANKISIIIVFLIIAVGGMIFLLRSQVGKLPRQEIDSSPTIGEEVLMKITSTAFENNQSIPAKYTCDGENVSPPLAVADVPESAQSLVLIVDDPDAPVGTFAHWLVWNIDPQTTVITEGNVPQFTVEGKNDFGKNSWGGPCPPSGTHRYFFKLYALDQKIDLPTSADKQDLEKAMEGYILSQTQLIGLYSRSR
jgi:hypothetical protein